MRFSLTIFVALLFIALWAHLGARRVLRVELDRRLAGAYELESAMLARGQTLPIQPGSHTLDGFIEAVNVFVVVRNAQGAIMEVNTPLARDLPTVPPSFAQAARGETVWITHDWHGLPVRSLFGPAPTGSRPEQVVMQVSASLAPLDAASWDVLFLMLGTVLLGTVATAFGAAWLASRAVEPVEEIATQARAIAPGSLGSRITAHANVQEFHSLIRVLNRMLERLDRGLESERRIIRDVGHDIRTPLTAMRGEVEVALRGNRDAVTYQRVLKSVLEEIDHLSSISEGLILLARIEADELTPERYATDMNTLAEHAVLRARTRSDGRALALHPGDGDVTAAVDPRMISVVLDHLLDNAVKHTPPGTRVEVSVDPGTDAVTVAVEDDGPGIREQDLQHIFERFYRTDSARTRSQSGAGLGLTIAAAIVEAHGGRIAATPAPTRGLRVALSLPRR